MMTRIFKHIKLALFLSAVTGFGFITLAQGDEIGNIISRPLIKYRTSNLRDPFAPVLVKEEKKEDTQIQKVDKINEQKVVIDALKVQGIIWGGKMPQAIINDKVLAVGDLIEDAEILNIAKNEITLSFAGEIVTLGAPGSTSPEKENNKEEK
ncbi:MAG: hypothetical protein WCY09_05715 [Candidatus Omnitrophota bacterium]